MLPYNKRTVRVTSPFGMRTLAGKTAMHKGIDLVGSDKNVLAVDSGEVLFSRMVDKATGNRTWEWGNYICIRTDDGMLHYYCHLESRAVRIGDKVAKGQVIGKEGSTGYSTGNHLHFEVRAQPFEMKDSGSSSTPLTNFKFPSEVLAVLLRVCSSSLRPFFTSFLTLPLTRLSRLLKPSVSVKSRPTFLI